jgi:hypothetical protein
VVTHHVAVEAGDGAVASFQQHVLQGSGERRLARAGQAGEEHDETAALSRREVLGYHVRDGMGRLARVAEDEDVVGVGGGHGPQQLLGALVVVSTGNGDGDHLGIRYPGGERCADQARAGQRPRPTRTGAHQQQWRAAGLARMRLDVVDVSRRQRFTYRHREGVGLGGADLRRAPVIAPERPVLAVGQRLDRADQPGAVERCVRVMDGETGDGYALGIEQLERAVLGGGGAGRRVDHQGRGAVGGETTRQRAEHKQLEVGELAR